MFTPIIIVSTATHLKSCFNFVLEDTTNVYDSGGLNETCLSYKCVYLGIKLTFVLCYIAHASWMHVLVYISSFIQARPLTVYFTNCVWKILFVKMRIKSDLIILSECDIPNFTSNIMNRNIIKRIERIFS